MPVKTKPDGSPDWENITSWDEVPDANFLGMNLTGAQQGGLVKAGAAAVGAVANNINSSLHDNYVRGNSNSEIAQMLDMNSIGDVINASEKGDAAIGLINSKQKDFSNITNNQSLYNAFDPNAFQNKVGFASDGQKAGEMFSSAASGAATGASIGSIIPGIGTAAGTVIGAGIGAFKSVFGSMARDNQTRRANRAIDLANKNQMASFNDRANRNDVNTMRTYGFRDSGY
jgi:hypothetical protein